MSLSGLESLPSTLRWAGQAHSSLTEARSSWAAVSLQPPGQPGDSGDGLSRRVRSISATTAWLWVKLCLCDCVYTWGLQGSVVRPLPAPGFHSARKYCGINLSTCAPGPARTQGRFCCINHMSSSPGVCYGVGRESECPGPGGTPHGLQARPHTFHTELKVASHTYGCTGASLKKDHRPLCTVNNVFTVTSRPETLHKLRYIKDNGF